jgi:pimeloyl-ACP methyl ester carboxylesterase
MKLLKWISFSFFGLFTSISLLSCSGGGSGGGGGNPIVSSTQAIQASIGGTVSLPNGSSVSFPAGSLPSDQNVTVTQLSGPIQKIPNSSIIGVGPSLTISFSPRTPVGGVNMAVTTASSATPSSFSDISISLNFSGNNDPNLNGSVPAASFSLTNPSSNTGPVFLVLPGHIDLGTYIASIIIPANYQAALFDNGLGVSTGDIHVYLQNTPAGAHILLYNLPYTEKLEKTDDPTIIPGTWEWKPTAVTSIAKIDKDRRTLILVHGVASTTRDAFPSEVALDIKFKGNYCQVIGFTYDWTQSVADSGSQLAKAIDDLGLTNIDIEAHSLGTVVSLDAASKINPSINIGNIVLLGGPINGTPAADYAKGSKAATNMLSILVNNPVPNLPALTLAALLEAPVFADLQTGCGDPADYSEIPCINYTGSQSLRNIRVAFGKNKPNVKVLTVAGTDRNFYGKVGRVIASLSNIKENFDGIIPESSASARLSNGFSYGLQSTLNNVTHVGSYDLTHVELESNPGVITGVANIVGAPYEYTMKLDPIPDPPFYLGQIFTIDYKIKDPAGNVVPIPPTSLYWSSTNSSVAIVDNKGEVQVLTNDILNNPAEINCIYCDKILRKVPLAQVPTTYTYTGQPMILCDPNVHTVCLPLPLAPLVPGITGSITLPLRLPSNAHNLDMGTYGATSQGVGPVGPMNMTSLPTDTIPGNYVDCSLPRSWPTGPSECAGYPLVWMVSTDELGEIVGWYMIIQTGMGGNSQTLSIYLCSGSDFVQYCGVYGVFLGHGPSSTYDLVTWNRVSGVFAFNEWTPGTWTSY